MSVTHARLHSSNSYISENKNEYLTIFWIYILEICCLQKIWRMHISRHVEFFITVQHIKHKYCENGDSNDLEACGMKLCCFWFHSDVKFLTRSLYSGERQWPTWASCYGDIQLSLYMGIFLKIGTLQPLEKVQILPFLCKRAKPQRVTWWKLSYGKWKVR